MWFDSRGIQLSKNLNLDSVIVFEFPGSPTDHEIVETYRVLLLQFSVLVSSSRCIRPQRVSPKEFGIKSFY